MNVRTRHQVGWLLLGLLLPGLLGCGSATVTGTVTYDDKPITRGKITFIDAEENGTAVGADIANGNYKIQEISPGKKKVAVLVQELPKRTDLSLPAEAAGDRTVNLTRGKQEFSFPVKELKSLSPAKK